MLQSTIKVTHRYKICSLGIKQANELQIIMDNFCRHEKQHMEFESFPELLSRKGTRVGGDFVATLWRHRLTNRLHNQLISSWMPCLPGFWLKTLPIPYSLVMQVSASFMEQNCSNTLLMPNHRRFNSTVWVGCTIDSNSRRKLDVILLDEDLRSTRLLNQKST